MGAAAMWWLTRRRTGDAQQAAVASLLVAFGLGFTTTAGTPMSYVTAFGLMALVLALAEWLAVFRAGSGYGQSLALGWAVGVAGLFYMVEIPLLLFIIWTYGLLRADLRKLVACTVVTLLVGLAWEAYGRQVAGLEMSADALGFARQSLVAWLKYARQGPPGLVAGFRASNLAGMLVAAFPPPILAIALAGLAGLRRDDADWYLAIGLSSLVAAAAMSQALQAPRIVYYVYPAVYPLAARASSRLGSKGGGLLTAGGTRAASAAGPLVVCAALVMLQAALANADLFGAHMLDVAFLFSVEHAR